MLFYLSLGRESRSHLAYAVGSSVYAMNFRNDKSCGRLHAITCVRVTSISSSLFDL